MTLKDWVNLGFKIFAVLAICWTAIYIAHGVAPPFTRWH